jgi:hypothetical protein
MNSDKNSSNSLLAIAIFIGLSILGFFVYKGLKTFSDKDRIVTVKGLAEMDIVATSASITIHYSVSGDELAALHTQSETKKNAILDYLKSNGYEASQLKVAKTELSDREHYYEFEWQEGKKVQVKVDRYSIAQNITITSKDVRHTEEKASQLKGDLISKNLTSNISTDYVFPELNSIKPKLIAESTKNARIAGEQFANDSQASLGKIKTASQGQITLANSYSSGEEGVATTQAPTEPYIQRARVVSTIVFFLE